MKRQLTVYIQRDGNGYSGWLDTEDGRTEYAWPNVARIRQWLKLYGAKPVVLDYPSLEALAAA